MSARRGDAHVSHASLTFGVCRGANLTQSLNQTVGPQLAEILSEGGVRFSRIRGRRPPTEYFQCARVAVETIPQGNAIRPILNSFREPGVGVG